MLKFYTEYMLKTYKLPSSTLCCVVSNLKMASTGEIQQILIRLVSIPKLSCSPQNIFTALLLVK